MSVEATTLLVKIQKYLQEANTGAPGMSEEIIEEAAENLKKVLRKTFNETRGDNFRISMSNMSKPLCQLLMERDKAPKEKWSYAMRMKMLVGDITEIVARAVLKGSGVQIEKSNQKVTLEFPSGLKINGEYDDKIDGAIWDVKSASSWSFRNKWSKGYEGLQEQDDFGYLGQLVGYSKADNSREGGWFVVNKENGEWTIAPSKNDPLVSQKVLDKVEANVFKVLDPNTKFERCFSDEPEYFRRKPTGNRVLGTTCGFCEFKYSCWPGLQHRAAVKSEAGNPPMVYYSVFVASSLKTEEEEAAARAKQTARKAKKKENNEAKVS